MLIGELIQEIREAITDQPQTLPAVSATVTTQAFANTLAPGTYAVIVTQRNPYGETLGSAETTGLVVNSGQTIQVASTLLPGAVAIRAYLTLPGGVPGSEVQFMESTVTPFAILTQPTNAGVPPTRNTAYLPDTDGHAFNATSIYRLINRALQLSSTVVGGLLDYSGVGTITNSPQYIVPGTWRKISSFWYDGYPLAMDDSGNYFRRNPITAAVLASVACSLFNNRMMVELWPQPARNAGSTTLATAMGPSDTFAITNFSGNFLLTNGFAKIGTEIVSYAGNINNVLLNLQRSLSGTVPQSWPVGTAVQELNAFWLGWRTFDTVYQPGNSGITLPIPTEWNSMLVEYCLGRIKLAEQNVKDFTTLDQSFVKKMAQFNMSNQVQVGPRQVGDQQNSLEVFPNFGGGFVIPALIFGFTLLSRMFF